MRLGARLRTAAAFKRLGGGINYDPYWDSVTSLLHFDENSTDVKGNSWQNSVSLSYDTTGVIGTHAAVFTKAQGDYIYLTDGRSVADFGTAPFTLEFRVKASTETNQQVVGTAWDGISNGTWIAFINHVNWPGKFVVLSDPTYTGNNAASRLAVSQMSVTDSAWHHIAIVRDGTSFKIFVDGDYTTKGSSETIEVGRSFVCRPTGDYSFILGCYKAANGAFVTANAADMQLDEFRITKGVARYTANFTPPALAFPNQ